MGASNLNKSENRPSIERNFGEGRAGLVRDTGREILPRDLRTKIVEAIVAPNCITDVYRRFRDMGGPKARDSRTVIIKHGTRTLIQRRPFRNTIHTLLKDGSQLLARREQLYV